MIVAERKPFDEILEMLKPYKRVLVLGCGGCVTVCLTGGEKQAEELASQLRLASKHKGANLEADYDYITRQCDREFVENLKESPDKYDCVLSLACGVGVQFMSQLYPDVPFLPAMNTTFYGAGTASGIWEEYCHGCGDCMLALTGGICPIARCSKSLVNGPCGGTNDGKCEISSDMDCAWHLIYKRLAEKSKLDEFRRIQPARDWRKEHGAGVRRLVLKEMVEEESEA
jgi:ferredoxin